MRYRVLPYRQGSKGAKALADALGGKVLKLEGSSFHPNGTDVVINWGNANPPSIPGWLLCTHNARADVIKNASNKLNFFNLMKAKGLADVIPDYWTHASEIPPSEFENDGKIVCRTVLAGHSGDGIVIASDPSGLVPAPLYVKYVKKQQEFRVHVGIRNQVTSPDPGIGPEPYTTIIAVQRKARRHDTPDDAVNWQVRNHQNGFIYARNGFTTPAEVLEGARKALEASGLDFGAVDVLWNEVKGKAYVLEINTAPGLEGQTVQDYAAFFKNWGS